MKTLLALLLCVCVCTTAQAFVSFDAHCHVIESGTRGTIEWAVEPGAVGYELQVFRMETGKTVYQQRVATNKLTIRWSTPGHYVLYVRWYKLIDGVNTFSEWKNSLERDSSLVLVGSEWTNKAWVIIVPTKY